MGEGRIPTSQSFDMAEGALFIVHAIAPLIEAFSHAGGVVLDPLCHVQRKKSSVRWTLCGLGG
jgi:hypothetical protein